MSWVLEIASRGAALKSKNQGEKIKKSGRKEKKKSGRKEKKNQGEKNKQGKGQERWKQTVTKTGAITTLSPPKSPQAQLAQHPRGGHSVGMEPPNTSPRAPQDIPVPQESHLGMGTVGTGTRLGHHQDGSGSPWGPSGVPIPVPQCGGSQAASSRRAPGCRRPWSTRSGHLSPFFCQR